MPIKIWLFVLLIVIAFVIGGGLSYGYKNGNCKLCKLFKKDKDIIADADEKGELDQDNANKLVSNMIKLGNIDDKGKFELTQGNEEQYQLIFDSLTKYGYNINYKSIIAEKSE